MRDLTEILTAQVEVNFYEAPEDEKRFIVGTAKAVNRAWLRERLEELDSLARAPLLVRERRMVLNELLLECSVQKDGDGK